MRIGIFEDSEYKFLQPLTYLRPTFDLRCGVLLLREKIENLFPKMETDYFVRTDLQEFCLEKYNGKKVNQFLQDDYLLLNGGVIFTKKLANELLNGKPDQIYFSKNRILAALISAERIKEITRDADGLLDFGQFKEMKELKNDVIELKYPWDYVHHNPEQIQKDCKNLSLRPVATGKKFDGVHFMSRENVYIDESARIDPGVVVDAEEGPVIIDAGAHIFPQATIIGPAYIGKKSLIKIGAKIYEGTSIGEVCKIGGELEESIIHSYSNKQHDGFLGHAYLGQWVNLGADTNNSDLKNNYGSVRVYVNGEEIDSGSTFVGLTMGDHSKSGINTMFNTGTVVGTMCNVYGSDFPPKWIPDFSWGGSAGFVEHDIEKALQVARKVMSRRKIDLGQAEEKLIRSVFEKTKKFRK